MKIFTKSKRTQPTLKRPPPSDYWYLYAQQPTISFAHNFYRTNPYTNIPVNLHEQYKCRLYNMYNTFNLNPEALRKFAEFKSEPDSKYDILPPEKEEYHEIW